jgi:cell division protein FtsN
MFRWQAYLPLALSAVTAVGSAQTAPRSVDPVFARAQELVSDGNGAAGRALVDSVLKANSPTSQIYPQALFWRASLAASAADAESDYKHIVVDYPLAPQAEDALLRLAQLELARGDRDAALAHLQRIPRDYPRSKSIARAHYWIARVLFEKNDTPNACAANANALRAVTADDIELQNQIQYQGQRCASYNASRSPPPADTAAAGKQTTAPIANSATGSAAVSSTPVAPLPLARSTDTARVVDSAGRQQQAANAPVQQSAARPKPPVEARDTKPSIVDRPKVTPEAARRASTLRAIAYSVQVAAYTKRVEAERLAASLAKRGYDARVDGDTAPFRVRIGRYQSDSEAEAALARIKAKHMQGFVVRAPER